MVLFRPLVGKNSRMTQQGQMVILKLSEMNVNGLCGSINTGLKQIMWVCLSSVQYWRLIYQLATIATYCDILNWLLVDLT